MREKMEKVADEILKLSYQVGEEIDELEFGDFLDCGSYGRLYFVKYYMDSHSENPVLWVSDVEPQSADERGWSLKSSYVKAINRDGVWYDVEWDKGYGVFIITNVRGE